MDASSSSSAAAASPALKELWIDAELSRVAAVGAVVPHDLLVLLGSAAVSGALSPCRSKNIADVALLFATARAARLFRAKRTANATVKHKNSIPKAANPIATKGSADDGGGGGIDEDEDGGSSLVDLSAISSAVRDRRA